MVEFVDGSVLAQMGTPDMRTPIAYALGFRATAAARPASICAGRPLAVRAPRPAPLPLPAIGVPGAAGRPSACIALNAANEVAVDSFLKRELPFARNPCRDPGGARRQSGRAAGIRSRRSFDLEDGARRQADRTDEKNMGFLTTIPAFLVALGLLIVVHELGHFGMARWCGSVLRFSSGSAGRSRAGSEARPDEWVIAVVPLGGYVKMLDERETESGPIDPSELPRAFNRQPVLRRAAIVAAGPVPICCLP